MIQINTEVTIDGHSWEAELGTISSTFLGVENV